MTTANDRKVVVMAGGTGGHVFPALAVARELRCRGVRVVWLGTRSGIEADLVPANDFPFHVIEVSGLRGKGVSAVVKAPVRLGRALRQALAILKMERPDAVLGMGGFASGPGGLAARLLGLPLVIHEQNAVAGTTNRLLAHLAKRVMQAFPGTLPNGRICGNPVRTEIVELPAPELRMGKSCMRNDRDRPHLLVLGGSLGAAAINDLLPGAMKRLPEQDRPQVWHQTGRDRAVATEEKYNEAGIDAHVVPFIDDMAEAYGWADLVVCRAGALTVSELAAVGVASILIPFPYAIDDHQTKNGMWLVENGAAQLVQQDELSPEKLAVMLQQLLADRPRLLEMAKNARLLAQPDSVKVVADACQEVFSEAC